MAMEDIRREATLEIAKQAGTLQIQHQLHATSAGEATRWQEHIQQVRPEDEYYPKDLKDQFHLQGEAMQKDYETRLTAARYERQKAEDELVLVKRGTCGHDRPRVHPACETKSLFLAWTRRQEQGD